MVNREKAKLEKAVPALLAKYGVLPDHRTDSVTGEQYLFGYSGPSRYGCPIRVSVYLDREPWLACKFDRPGKERIDDIPHANGYSGKCNCHTFGLATAADVLEKFEYHLIEHCPAQDT